MPIIQNPWFTRGRIIVKEGPQCLIFMVDIKYVLQNYFFSNVLFVIVISMFPAFILFHFILKLILFDYILKVKTLDEIK